MLMKEKYIDSIYLLSFWRKLEKLRILIIKDINIFFYKTERKFGAKYKDYLEIKSGKKKYVPTTIFKYEVVNSVFLWKYHSEFFEKKNVYE